MCTVFISYFKIKAKSHREGLVQSWMDCKNICGDLIWKTTKDPHLSSSKLLEGGWTPKCWRPLGCWWNILEGDNLFLSVFSAWMTYFAATCNAAMILYFIIGSNATESVNRGLISKTVTSNKPAILVNTPSQVLLIVIKKTDWRNVKIEKEKKTNKVRLLNHQTKLMATTFLFFFSFS